jgi:diguanylate cyclase (GGDEF)-like protein
MTVTGNRTLEHEVTDAYRIVIASALAMLTVLAAAVAWVVVVGNPALDRTARVVNASQAVSAGLLEEQSTLRAYVVTGDRTTLTSYPALRDSVAADLGRVRSEASGRPGRLSQVLALDVTRWQHAWARDAAQPASRQVFLSGNGALDASRLAAFVRSGRPSFTAAQDTVHQLIGAGNAAQDDARERLAEVALGTAALLLAIAAVAAVASVRGRRSLRQRIVGPVAILLEKVQAVGRGDFDASPLLDAPQELMELRDGLADMSGSLKLQQQVLSSRAEEAAANARRQQLVVDFAREISDSLTLSNVFEAVTSTARRVVESPRARIWLVDDDQQTLRLRYDSITGDVVGDATQLLGEGVLGRAARDHEISYSPGLAGVGETGSRALVVAVPLVKGTRLVGVLEIALQPDARWLDSETIDMLIATAAHAATAIDAALLYSLAESLARVDALTGLANRRQLDTDLELEIERAARYGRPLAFLMIDVDHFKEVNDTFGHALGDDVLQGLASVLREHMRAGDTAYRYGGEEFAILARETDSDGGWAVGERLRRAVERQYAAHAAQDIPITVSIGLASDVTGDDTAADLITAADRALYDAKHGGRNQVGIAVRAVPSDPSVAALG